MKPSSSLVAWAIVPCMTNAVRCAMPIRLISLRGSTLPCQALPYGAMSETWPMKPEVQAWPPVLE